jgi:hypothetical protein
MITILVDGVEKTLSYPHEETGTDMIEDFLGNNHAFCAGNIEVDSEGGFKTTQENFDWWQSVIEKNIACAKRIAELKEERSSDEVESVVHSVGSLDLEDHADAVFAALDEAFGEAN